MRKLSLMVLFLSCWLWRWRTYAPDGPTGKWRLLVQSGGVAWITLDGMFLRNGDVVTAQQGFFSARGTRLGSSCIYPYAAAFSNGIVKDTEFSGSFAPVVTNFDDVVVNLSAILSPVAGAFTETGA